MTDIYRAISDPIRRKIIRLVANEEQTQSAIVQHFSISQPAIKKHLNILKDEGLIGERREGKYCYYKLNTEVYNEHFKKMQSELGFALEQKLASLKNSLEEGADK